MKRQMTKVPWYSFAIPWDHFGLCGPGWFQTSDSMHEVSNMETLEELSIWQMLRLWRQKPIRLDFRLYKLDDWFLEVGNSLDGSRSHSSHSSSALSPLHCFSQPKMCEVWYWAIHTSPENSLTNRQGSNVADSESSCCRQTGRHPRCPKKININKFN